MYVEVVSPTGRVFQGQATNVRAPGVEGSFAVQRGHAPMIAAFTVGPLTITTSPGETVTFATSGGFLEVLNDVVTVLAETAEPATAIDLDRARDAEERAKEALRTSGTDSEARTKAEAALERARNRARVAMGQVGTA
jgi:F-type H+-transporting ATPase subunit epsilon